MPNHWHLVVWPKSDGELSRFVGWLTLTHTQRWHAHRQSTGSGHVYQGRFKSFPVQDDEHFLTLCRYVERNALRANLVDRAESWRWGSLYRWKFGNAEEKKLLAKWPIPRRPGWIDQVNTAVSESELVAIRNCAKRGSPYDASSWLETTVSRLSLDSTIRPRGRPKKIN